MIFNTTQKMISKIEVDFNNGQGWQTVIKNKSIEANYSKNGKKIIDFKIILSNGEILRHSNSINIEEKAIELNREANISQRSPFYYISFN
jgi:hypothetical protein